MAKKTVADETPAPETLLVCVSSIDAETEEPCFTASSKGKVVAKVWGRFYIRVPATMAAAEALCAGASTSFEGEDGSEVKLTGALAPLARKYYADALEPKRGELREMALEGVEVTPQDLQAMLDAAAPYSGRGGGFRKPVASQEALDEAMKAGNLAEYLRKIGVVVD